MNRRRAASHHEPGLSRLLLNGALLTIIVVFGTPFLWIAGSAFEGAAEVTGIWPQVLTLDNFRAVFAEQNVGLALKNSAIVATASMVLATMLAAMAGYGLSRLRVRGKRAIVYAMILLYAIPLAVTMVALYDLATRLEMVNTLWGLTVAQTAIILPFLSWLMMDFYDGAPRYLEEAAWLDGGSHLRVWAGVVTPAVIPGVLLTAGLAFVLAWSEVLLAIILISDRDLTTISRQFFTTADGSTGAETAALGVLYVLPVLAIFLVIRRLIARHVQASEEGM